MPSDLWINKRLLVLKEELDKIHFANSLYWKQQPTDRSRQEKAEYQRRQVRVEEIRKELSALTMANDGYLC